MGQQSGFVCKFVRLCVLPFLIGGSTAWGQVRPRVVQAVNNDQRITLKGNVHPLARAEFDRGAVVESQPMTRMLLLLKRSDDQEAALQQYLDSQQDKSSPNYHAWLTPEEFGANYGPADADVQAVTDWLANQGFTVEKVYSSKTVIEFSGTAGAVESAFGTAIRNFEIGGKTYMANASDPQIPAALAPVVAGIVSLNNFPRQSHVRIVGQARKVAGKPGLEPLLTFPFGNGTFYGMSPGDFATIYNTAPLLTGNPKIDGTGQTIAIVGETNIHVSDVQAFRTMFGLPANFDATNVILNGEDPGITSPGEEGEADLDVEWSGAVAPGATVKFVVSASTPASAGIDLSALYIVEHNLAGAMSESYGSCESGLGTVNAFYNSLWQQAAAQGITVMVSTGDNGSAGCDDFNTPAPASHGLAVNGLASTPYNVAVGGTDFDEVNKWSTFWSATNSATGTSALSYIPEIPWNESCAQIGLTGCGANAPQGSLNIVAGGGGPSSTYSKPNWQLGVTGMPNDSHRDLPDVSLFASSGFNGTGYIYCQSDQTITGAAMCDITNINNGGLDFGIVGGTSASSPAFAGIMALVNQYEANNGGTNRQGNANNVLYALAKKTGAGVFNDVTKGNSVLPTGGAGVGTNSVPCTGGTLNCSSAVASANGVLVDPANAKTEAWTAGVGYDMATGLGSVNVNNMASQWKTANATKTTTTLTLSPMTGITHGTTENVSVNITVTPTSAAGSVSLIAKFTDGTTRGLDQFTLASGKVVNGTTNSLPGGTFSVTAHYAGDGTNAPSDSAAVNVTVMPENSKTFIVVPSFDASGNLLNGNATSVQYGSNYIIRMYVTDKNGVASATGPPSPTCATENALTCPSGTVTLTDSGTAVGTGGGGAGIYNLNSQGYTRNLSPNLTGGTHTLIASYSGDVSYQASNSGPLSFTVTPAPTQIQLTPGLPSITVGQPINFVAVVTSQVVSGVTPGGTVTFYDGNTQLPGTVTISPDAGAAISAFITTSFATTGPQTITAKYSGDNNYAAGSSNAVTVASLIPTSMTQSESAKSINYGQSITVTATVTGNSKTPVMTGQITFYDPTFSVVQNVQTTTGTDANGNQTMTATETTTPQSSTSISAQYSGDANYAAATTPGDFISVNIPDFSLPNNTAITITAGQTATATMNVTPLSNIPSPVTLSTIQVPSGMTLTMKPATVNLNGSAVPVVLTLSSTAPSGGPTSAAAKAQLKKSGVLPVSAGGWWSLSMASAIALLYLVGLPGRRRRYRATFLMGVLCLVSFALGCGGGGNSGGGGGGGGGTGGGGTGAGGSTFVPTTTTVTTSNAKVPAVGGSFTLTATVTSTNPITGTVMFSGPGIAFPYPQGVPVVNGVASYTIQTPYAAAPYSVGIYNFTAQYSGDANNGPSMSATGINEAFTGTTTGTVMGQTSNLTHQATLTITLQ
jgi:subtilase family serine protease